MQSIPMRILSIVSSPYVTFKGEDTQLTNESNGYGLFVLLDINYNTNTAIGAKLTSNLQINSTNAVFIQQVDCPCLRTNSLLYIDQLHTLDLTRCTVIGNINNKSIYNIIYKQVKSMAFKFVDNLKTCEAYGLKDNTSYTSPNKQDKETMPLFKGYKGWN